jgi:hypothetical protein
MKLPKNLSKYRLSTINHWEHKSYAPPGKFTLWMTDWMTEWMTDKCEFSPPSQQCKVKLYTKNGIISQ